MSKLAIKNRISIVQHGECALTLAPLNGEQKLNDTDRILPKALGGDYQDENTRIVLPRAHMLRHGTLRTREESLEHLKALFDDRVQMMKLMLKENNQLLAYQRKVDHMNPDTESFLVAHLKPIQDRLNQIDRNLEKAITAHPDALSKKALGITGIGPITVAALTVYIDLNKADTPSALWKYTGLDKSAGERYSKGVAGGGNKTLRTVLWNTANCMMRVKTSDYRPIYDRVKLRLSQSEKLVKSRNRQGKSVEVAWKDTMASHRHGAALRAVMKMLLSDYWLIGRQLAGLPITTPYVEGVLGHTDISPPSDRGWTI